MAPRYAALEQQYQRGMFNRANYVRFRQDLERESYQNTENERRNRQQVALAAAQSINQSARVYAESVKPVPQPVIVNYSVAPAPVSYRYVPNGGYNTGGTLYPNAY